MQRHGHEYALTADCLLQDCRVDVSEERKRTMGREIGKKSLREGNA